MCHVNPTHQASPGVGDFPSRLVGQIVQACASRYTPTQVNSASLPSRLFTVVVAATINGPLTC